MLYIVTTMALWPWQCATHVAYHQMQQVNLGTQSQATWIQVPASPSVSCVTLDTCLNLSESQLLIYEGGLHWLPVSRDCYGGESG